MAQTTDYEIANSSGLVFRGRVNEVLAAVQSSNSGATAPTDTAAGMLWFDTSVTPAILRRRNAGDSAWIDVYSTEDLASQAEAEAGSNNTKLMTPLRTKQAIETGSKLITSFTHSTNVTAINFTGLSGFRDIRVVIIGLINSTSALDIQVSTDNGSTYITTGYSSGVIDGVSTDASSTAFMLTRGAAGTVSGEARLNNFGAANEISMVGSARGGRSCFSNGRFTGTTARNALRITGGTFSGGSIQVYGEYKI